MFGGLALLVIGNFVSIQTFLRMRLAIEYRNAWQSFASGLWISSDRAKKIEAKYLARGGSSKVLSINRIAHRTSIVGIVGLVAGLVAMCSTFMH